MISNICRANFSGGRTAQGNNRFQWDYGQILEISGIENLPDPFTAQFSNYPVLGTAKTTVGTGGRVEIPNEYFVSGQNIYCFIVLHTDEDDGRTVYVATIPVTKRPKPIDDPITPTQQSTIDTAIAALQAGVARAEGFAGDAEEQATIATGAATTATEAAETATGAVDAVEAAATRAETAADGAEASATAAEASATDAESAKTAALAAKDAAETAAASAEQSATDAGNYAGLAEEAERDAQAAKTAAEASATAAAGSASEASGSASQAAQKASEAASSATAAQTSATNAEAAKTGAETAQEAAETAQGKAEEAAGNAQQSATTAEWYAERVERFLPTDTASGEIASFPDGADGVPMQSVVVSMEPVQDLHGYDSPWPAGGGKNKCDGTAYSCVISSNIAYILNRTPISSPHTTTVHFGGAGFVAPVKAGQAYAMSSDAAGSAEFFWAIYASLEDITDRTKVLQSGSAQVTFTADYDGYVVFMRENYPTGQTVAWTYAQLELGSSATAFAPYSNICPITGWDGVKVTRTGKNLSPLNTKTQRWAEDNRDLLNALNALPVGTYCLSYSSELLTLTVQNPNSWTTGFIFINSTGNNVKARSTKSSFAVGDIVSVNATFNVTPNTAGKFTNAYGYGAGNDSQAAIGTARLFDIQIELGSTATSYEPYQGETISVTFPTEAGTVYGGTLDVVSGELVVDRASVDLGTLSWNYVSNSAFNLQSTTDIGALPPATTSIVPNAVSSVYPVLSYFGVSEADKSMTIVFATSGQAGKVWAHDTSYSDAATFKTAVTGQQLVYMLNEPITYHLTPQEVLTLLGTNNVWSDAGSVAVTYKADVQLYIDKRISALS